MTTYGTLTKLTKHNYTSTWHFCEVNGEYYAFGGCHKPLVKRFDTVEELQEYYQQMCAYGYAPLGMPTIAQLELAVA